MYGIVLVFDGVGEDRYWKVNELLGIERDGSGDWPDGLRSHTAGRDGDRLVVAEVWDTKGDQESFMGGRLGAALGEAQIPEPSQIIETELVNHQQL